jgi:branched-chain amino acid transport system permease protein
MNIEVKFAFDVLAFISVMVPIVLGLGVIASMMGIFNFAHGEFVVLGAYTVYLFESSGLSARAGIVVAPVVLALIGLVLERLVIRFHAAPIIAMPAPMPSGW